MVSIKEFPRGIEAGLSVEVSKALCEISMTSNCLKSDQVISLRAHDGECERAPWSGPQAPSTKLQAPSLLSNKLQASSPSLQALSSKPQASSSKILDPS